MKRARKSPRHGAWCMVALRRGPQRLPPRLRRRRPESRARRRSPGVGSASTRPPAISPATSASVGSPAPSATAPPGATPATGKPCGELGCRAFETPRAAFEYATRGAPRIVAVGEAHAQKTATGVESATTRFAHELLPALAPHVKGIVIELLTPDRRCAAHEEQAVAERTHPVTAPQAATNQSDFIALGFAAKRLGIEPKPLVPSCDELAAVLAAGSGDIATLLALIATVTVRESVDFLDHRSADQGLAIYGGLLHNDVSPSPEHAAWSFGARLSAHVSGSYVEVDLIVPELIRNEEPWTTLPWFSHFDPARANADTWLFQTGPASYVLIFPKTATTSP